MDPKFSHGASTPGTTLRELEIKLRECVRYMETNGQTGNIDLIREAADVLHVLAERSAETLSADAAIYLSDLAEDHAAQVRAGSETVEHALRTVAVLGFDRGRLADLPTGTDCDHV